MQKNILIINNHDSFTYNLVELIRQLNTPFQVVNVEDLQIEQVNLFSHILISPGPDVPQAYPQLFEMLRHFYRSKSILGICLGHQTLCTFFGGQLINLSKVRHGQQRLLNVRLKSPLFLGLPQHFKIGLYHSWAVSTDNFPQDLQIMAYCDEEIVMAVKHKTLNLFGVQFHPESYMSEYGKTILQNWLNASEISQIS